MAVIQPLFHLLEDRWRRGLSPKCDIPHPITLTIDVYAQDRCDATDLIAMSDTNFENSAFQGRTNFVSNRADGSFFASRSVS